MRLRRNSTERIELPNGKTVHVPKCITSFQPWRDKPVPRYGGKALLTLNRKPLFAELVVLAMLKREGWKGVWVDSYGRKYRTGMPYAREPVALPPAEEEFLKRIRTTAGCRGGCFDVFAWHGKNRRFVELKRQGKDRIRETQKRWLDAALKCGTKNRDILIVEWNLARN